MMLSITANLHGGPFDGCTRAVPREFGRAPSEVVMLTPSVVRRAEVDPQGPMPYDQHLYRIRSAAGWRATYDYEGAV